MTRDISHIPAHRPTHTGCGFHDIDSLADLAFGITPRAFIDAIDESDAQILDALDALDDQGALDLLDTLPPVDAARIASLMGA